MFSVFTHFLKQQKNNFIYPRWRQSLQKQVNVKL